VAFVELEVGDVFENVVAVVGFAVVFFFEEFELDGGFYLAVIVFVLNEEVDAGAVGLAFEAVFGEGMYVSNSRWNLSSRRNSYNWPRVFKIWPYSSWKALSLRAVRPPWASFRVSRR
jgi:hypothetical protein